MAKRYLDVSYDDRELAKRLGAKWDPSVRRWYCPTGSPLAKIFKWRAEAQMAAVKTEIAKPQIAPSTGSQTAPQTAMNQNFELFMAS